MEWRCEWCGKPHAEDDPPCDNCGHGTFEQAVVPKASESSEPATSTVWVCTECGREHVKHSPPCSRCGNVTLEQQELSAEDFEDVGPPGYRDLITTRYAIGLVAALALAAVFVAGVTGVVHVPGLTPEGLSVDGVPGSADEADGLDLQAVEDAVVTELDDRLGAGGDPTLDRVDGLDAVARFTNQRRIKAALTDDSLPSLDRASERLADICSGTPRLFEVNPRSIPDASDLGSPIEAARAIVDGGFGTEAGSLVDGTDHEIGVDVHAVEGDLYVHLAVC